MNNNNNNNNTQSPPYVPHSPLYSPTSPSPHDDSEQHKEEEKKGTKRKQDSVEWEDTEEERPFKLKNRNKRELLIGIRNTHNLYEMYDDESLFSDIQVRLVNTQRTLHLHKMVLYSHSKYFKTLLKSGFKETTTNVIEIENDEFDWEESIMEELFQAMYRDHIYIDPAQFARYFIMCEKYELIDLNHTLWNGTRTFEKTEIDKLLELGILENLYSVHYLNSYVYNDLYQIVLKLFVRYMDTVIRDERLYQLPREFFSRLLKLINREMGYGMLVYVLDKWITTNQYPESTRMELVEESIMIKDQWRGNKCAVCETDMKMERGPAPTVAHFTDCGHYIHHRCKNESHKKCKVCSRRDFKLVDTLLLK